MVQRKRKRTGFEGGEVEWGVHTPHPWWVTPGYEKTCRLREGQGSQSPYRRAEGQKKVNGTVEKLIEGEGRISDEKSWVSEGSGKGFKIWSRCEEKVLTQWDVGPWETSAQPGLLMVTEKGGKSPPEVDASSLNASDGNAECLPAGLWSRMVRAGTRLFFSATLCLFSHALCSSHSLPQGLTYELEVSFQETHQRIQ